jgi:hypothetical protein
VPLGREASAILAACSPVRCISESPGRCQLCSPTSCRAIIT